MTRTTSSLHIEERQLSPGAALRALRSIAYGQWDAFAASPGVPASTLSLVEEIEATLVLEVFETEGVDGECPEWDALESEYPEADVPVLDLRVSGEELHVPAVVAGAAAGDSEGSCGWYLNEVPAEWIDDTWPGDRPCPPVRG